MCEMGKLSFLDYLKSCQISSPTKETAAIKNHFYASSSNPITTKQHQKHISPQSLLVVLGCVAFAAAGIIISVVVWIYKRKRSHNEGCPSNDSLLLKVPETDRGKEVV